MRQTMVDIARVARVSTATVDRVLHDRAGVRGAHTYPGSRGRARDRLPPGYGRADRGRAPALRLRPAKRPQYLHGPARRPIWTRRGHARGAELCVQVHRVDGFSPEALASSLRALKGVSDGVAIIAIDHPLVREAIREVASAGTPVMTLVSDIAHAPRLGYVGIDNRNAGRLAGHLLGRFVPGSAGEVALFAGSLSYRGHEEREMGFRHILAEDFPNLRIVELREVRDDLERSYAEAAALLAARPELCGIYNIGAGNRGIARALEESGRAREVVFVGHELTEHTRRFLLSGTMDAVIDQNPCVEAREAIEQLLMAARGEHRADPVPIRIHAIFRENIPEVL